MDRLVTTFSLTRTSLFPAHIYGCLKTLKGQVASSPSCRRPNHVRHQIQPSMALVTCPSRTLIFHRLYERWSNPYVARLSQGSG
eukprot:5090292-Amphidinium_carterae.1